MLTLAKRQATPVPSICPNAHKCTDLQHTGTLPINRHTTKTITHTLPANRGLTMQTNHIKAHSTKCNLVTKTARTEVVMDQVSGVLIFTVRTEECLDLARHPIIPLHKTNEGVEVPQLSFQTYHGPQVRVLEVVVLQLRPPDMYLHRLNRPRQKQWSRQHHPSTQTTIRSARPKTSE